MYKCEICGEKFKGRQKSKANRFCSKKCQYKGMKKKVKKVCEVCGKEFKVHECRKNIAKYCSHQCQYKSMEKKVTFKCKNCGKKFKHWKSKENERKFCSRKCYTKYTRGVNSPNFEPSSYITNKCPTCGKLFIVRPKQLNKGEGKHCSKECAGKANSGENNHAWRGGKSFEPYPPEFNKYFKKEIKERDNYKCQVCGTPRQECEFYLSVHHIDYDKENNLKDNLITLCNDCHLETNTNRGYWKNHFQNLMEVKQHVQMEMG